MYFIIATIYIICYVRQVAPPKAMVASTGKSSLVCQLEPLVEIKLHKFTFK